MAIYIVLFKTKKKNINKKEGNPAQCPATKKNRTSDCRIITKWSKYSLRCLVANMVVGTSNPSQ